MQKHLIIYLNQVENLFGFAIKEKQSAKNYMACVKKLANKEAAFVALDRDFTYDIEDFSNMKITDADEAVLEKLFDLNEDDTPIGIFPDAVSDCYEYDLSDGNEED